MREQAAAVVAASAGVGGRAVHIYIAKALL